MRWRSICAPAALLLLSFLALPAQASERVALVIGNAAYAHAPRLANPLNDVADIGAALERLGFAVTRLENADYAALRRGLLEFTQGSLRPPRSRWCSMPGHGIEVDQAQFPGARWMPASAERPGHRISRPCRWSWCRGRWSGLRGLQAGDSGRLPGEPVCGLDAARRRDALDRPRPGARGALRARRWSPTPRRRGRLRRTARAGTAPTALHC